MHEICVIVYLINPVQCCWSLQYNQILVVICSKEDSFSEDKLWSHCGVFYNKTPPAVVGTTDSAMSNCHWLRHCKWSQVSENNTLTLSGISKNIIRTGALMMTLKCKWWSYATDKVVLMQLVYYTEVGPGISHLYLKYPTSKLCQLSYTLYSEWN